MNFENLKNQGKAGGIARHRPGMRYWPARAMCLRCRFASEDCSSLPFDQMSRIEVIDHDPNLVPVTLVRCSSYAPASRRSLPMGTGVG